MNTGEGDPDGRRHHPWPGASVQRLVLPGTVQAWYEAPIYARVNGYLEAWHFDHGARVNKGDVLGEIKTPDVDAQLSAAQAKLNSAKAVVKVREAERQFAQSTYQRWRDSPKGVVSVQEQENKQADYNSSVARVNPPTPRLMPTRARSTACKALEGFKKIMAPFDGVVTARKPTSARSSTPAAAPVAATDRSYSASLIFRGCAFMCRCRSKCRREFDPA